MILLLIPVIVMIICIILSHKIRDVDTNGSMCVIATMAFVIFLVLSIICFLMRICDYDKFQIDAERANIVRYIERYGDDAETNEDVYNTIYDKVYNFNYLVYRHQRGRSNPLTSWFRAGWWMEIEPIDWAP